MFRKAHTAAWPNATFLGFFDGAVQIIDKNLATLREVPAVFTPVHAQFKTEVTALGDLFKEGGSPLTGRLQQLDALRDGQYTGMSLQVRAFTYHDDGELAAAATLVERCMELYGPRLTVQSYMNQTVALSNLLKDLRDKPELAGALRALPAVEVFRAPLDRYNTEFNDLYLQRVADKASEPDLKTVDQQDAVITAYETVLKKIDGFIEVSAEPAPWLQLRSELTVLWQQYANAEAIRLGKAAAAEKKAGERMG